MVSDDIYEHIMFRGLEFSNILNAAPSLADRTLVLNGVSKVYSMTGWRIGYVAGPEAGHKAHDKNPVTEHLQPKLHFTGCSGSRTVNGDQDFVADMRDAFEERHDFIVNALNEIDGINCPLSDGTFYCFPNIEGLIKRTADVSDDVGFVEHLLNQAGVAVVPGTAFGSPGYMRISYATSMDTLEKVVTRLKTL